MLNELQLITVSNWCQSQTDAVVQCIKDVATNPDTIQLIMNWHPL